MLLLLVKKMLRERHYNFIQLSWRSEHIYSNTERVLVHLSRYCNTVELGESCQCILQTMTSVY
jgi:hypothetical protein